MGRSTAQHGKEQPGQAAQESGTGVQFEVESVDIAYQELQAQGFTLMAPLRHSPGRLVTLNDPDSEGYAGPSPLTDSTRALGAGGGPTLCAASDAGGSPLACRWGFRHHWF